MCTINRQTHLARASQRQAEFHISLSLSTYSHLSVVKYGNCVLSAFAFVSHRANQTHRRHVHLPFYANCLSNVEKYVCKRKRQRERMDLNRKMMHAEYHAATRNYSVKFTNIFDRHQTTQMQNKICSHLITRVARILFQRTFSLAWGSCTEHKQWWPQLHVRNAIAPVFLILIKGIRNNNTNNKIDNYFSLCWQTRNSYKWIVEQGCTHMCRAKWCTHAH